MKIKHSFTFLLLIISTEIFANVTLPNIFGSGMVLQQNSKVRLWGDASTGEDITIICSWDDAKYTTKGSNQGKWEVTIKTPNYGGPYKIEILGRNKILLENILIGEVWLVSGQSNMEWTANSGIDNAKEEIQKAKFNEIRLFTVAASSADFPQKNLNGTWNICSPETMQNFSAVGYFFAQNLYNELKIPIGIINSSWGGSPAEAWVPKDKIEADPVLNKDALDLKEVPWAPIKIASIYNAMIAPLQDFTLKGFLWYQGESNVSHASNYDKLLNTLINSWRAQWHAELPFYFVQIAPYKYGNNEDGVTLRNAQRMAEKIKNTAMVVISDIGDINDIHPKNKKDVGTRLANIALKNQYNVGPVKINEPKILTYEIKKNKIILYFDTEDINCNSKCKNQFEIADINGKFISAQVKVRSNSISISHPSIDYPLFARFAWGNTELSELKNKEGMPVSSFITDNWWEFKNQ